MIAGVADTHTAIWYLSRNSRLSQTAKAFLDTVGNNGDEIAIASISLVEMIYLIEKGKIPVTSVMDKRKCFHLTPLRLASPLHAVERGMRGEVSFPQTP